MVRHLFPDFLKSDAAYRQAASFWRQLIREAAASRNQVGDWLPWRPATYVDKTPIPRDIRPIVDARSAKLARAITILQHEPTEATIEFDAWIDVRGPANDEGDNSRTDDLTISLALSEEAVVVARTLIEHWMDPALSRERVEDLIDVTRKSNE